jgi:hypothetical protein
MPPTVDHIDAGVNLILAEAHLDVTYTRPESKCPPSTTTIMTGTVTTTIIPTSTITSTIVARCCAPGVSA